MLFFELLGEVVHDAHVEVFTTKERVAVRRLHLEEAVVDLQDGDVERTTAEVIDCDGLRLFLVEPVGQCGGRRFVDDAQHFKTGDLAGVLGGLTLGVVEIGRNRDDGLFDLLAKIGFGGFLHLLKNHGADLRGRIFLTLHLDPGVAVAAIDDGVGNELLIFLDFRVAHAAPDQALDREDGVRGVGDRLTLGRLADEAFAVGEADNRGGGAGAFRVFDDAWLRPVHDGDAGVRGPEVDPDDFSHMCYLSFGDDLGSGPIAAPGPDPKFSAGVWHPDQLRGVYKEGSWTLQAL